MRDIHSHILYGIDDGSPSKEDSIKLLKDMEDYGITDIILTPHYIENSLYMVSLDIKIKLINELQKYTKINLYIGNEVYINNNILELLKQKQISTLNNSRYLLVELPMSSKINNLEDTMYNLIKNGIIPIIAHPERYTYVQENINYLDDLKELGVLFQSNYESIFGKYGNIAKKTIKKLLKNNYISFLGSDLHRVSSKNNTKRVQKKLNKYLTDDDIKKLTDVNILKVINNQEISL